MSFLSLILFINLHILAQAQAQITEPFDEENLLPPAVYTPNMDQTYQYDPKGKRDPFKPFIIIEQKLADQPQNNNSPKETSKNTLEDADMGQLNLVAVMWDVDSPKALVELNGGKTFVITKGQKIGRRNGKVALIREREVVIIEEFKNGNETLYQSHILTFKR